MPSVGLVIHEIGLKLGEYLENNTILQGKMKRPSSVSVKL